MKIPKHGDGWKGRHILVTRSGKVLEFGNMSVDDIDIEDIAWALSNLCRFTGHTSVFYSVAQHSILCSNRLEGSPTEKLRALLHDSAEAYINDLSSPLKAHIRGRYMKLHNQLDKLVAMKFGLGKLMTPKVKLVDQVALIYEWQAFFFQFSYNDSKALGLQMDLIGEWPDWTPSIYEYSISLSHREDVYDEFLEVFYNLTNRIAYTKGGTKELDKTQAF